MANNSRSMKRKGIIKRATDQAQMAADILERESATASKALFMHAAYHVAVGPLRPGFTQAMEDEVKRVAGQRNLTSREFFEKCVQAAMLAMRNGVKPFNAEGEEDEEPKLFAEQAPTQDPQE